MLNDMDLDRAMVCTLGANSAVYRDHSLGKEFETDQPTSHFMSSVHPAIRSKCQRRGVVQ